MSKNPPPVMPSTPEDLALLAEAQAFLDAIRPPASAGVPTGTMNATLPAPEIPPPPRSLADELHGEAIKLRDALTAARARSANDEEIRLAQMAYDTRWLEYLDALHNPKRAQKAAKAAPTPAAAAVSNVKLISATTIEPEAINWLWHSHLARGKLSILAGVAGTGKSTVAFDLAATVSKGGLWPDDSKCPQPGNVLIWSGEDDPADTIIPRLIAAAADLSRVHIITGGKAPDGSPLPFDPASDVPRLREEINRIGGAALMIIDPIVSAVAGDMHKANDVRRGLQAVIDLSAAFDCSVVGISHFSKGSKGSSPQERVIGSQAFAALARLVLVCAKSEDGDTRVLMRAKSNISLDHGGFNYNIVPVTIQGRHGPIDTTKVEWGEPLEGNARDILSEMEGEPEKKDDKSGKCADAMRAVLCGPDGQPVEMLSTDMNAQLKAEGYSPKMIEIARRRLNVAIRYEGFGKNRKVFCRLPDATAVRPPIIPAVPGA
jgi:putative DNA primase/helicase